MTREQTNEIIQGLVDKGHHGGYIAGGTREEIEEARLAKEQAEIDYNFTDFTNCWADFSSIETLIDAAEEFARYDTESGETLARLTLHGFRRTLIGSYYKQLVAETADIFFTIGDKITGEEKAALERNLIHSFRVLIEAGKGGSNE